MWCSSCVFQIPESKLLIHQLAVYPSGPAFLRLKQEQNKPRVSHNYGRKGSALIGLSPAYSVYVAANTSREHVQSH